MSRESSFCGTIINPCAFEHEFIFAEHCEPVEVAKGMPFEEEKSEENKVKFVTQSLINCIRFEIKLQRFLGDISISKTSSNGRRKAKNS